MIAFGVAAVKRFGWITVVFAAILLVSSYKLLVETDDEDHDLSQNTLVRWASNVTLVLYVGYSRAAGSELGYESSSASEKHICALSEAYAFMYSLHYYVVTWCAHKFRLIA